jgi:hypothetical protein
MSTYKCPQYSGSGAPAGRATCQFFATADSHPGVKWAAIGVLLLLAFLCLRYLRTGKIIGKPKPPEE